MRLLLAFVLIGFLTGCASSPGTWGSLKKSHDGLPMCRAAIKSTGYADIYEIDGSFLFSQAPVKTADGKFLRFQRTLASGQPWPHDFAVYGTTSRGGLDSFAADIAAIRATLPNRIDEIFFLSKNTAEVKTVISEGYHFGFYKLRKIKGVWIVTREQLVYS